MQEERNQTSLSNLKSNNLFLSSLSFMLQMKKKRVFFELLNLIKKANEKLCVISHNPF